MNKIRNIFRQCAALFLVVVLTGSCEENTGDVKVTHLTVAEAQRVATGKRMMITFKDNETKQITVGIIPENAANQELRFVNESPALMTVSATGLITPLTFGTGGLTIEATDGSGVSTSYIIEIIDHRIPVTGITISPAGTDIQMKINGAPFDLGACIVITPADAYNKSVTYVSSCGGEVVTVDENGIITPVAVGTTVITVTTADGTNLSRQTTVTVADLLQQWADFDRTPWTIYSRQGNEFASAWEWGVAGLPSPTGIPEHILEGGNSYLGLLKSGRSGGHTALGNTAAQPATRVDFLPYFTVDMKESKTFNYFRWRHRGGNANQQLRVFGVHVYGSNDGTNFTQILPEEPEADFDEYHLPIFWIPVTGGYEGTAARTCAAYHYIYLPESTWRYVKIEYRVWSNNYDTNWQDNPTREIGLRRFQHPDWQGQGMQTFGNTCQASEFNLGFSWWE